MTTRRLKHLARIAVSNVDKKTASAERPVRLCNYTDVYYNERITPDLPFMEATASADQIERFGLRAGDVLLTKDSETSDDIAVPAYVVADLPGVVCGYHLALLRPGQEVDGRYLFWALTSRSSREQFSASANGITRFGLRYDSFGEVRVPLPPLERQRAIADHLDRETARIDALIEKYERLEELLRRRLDARISQATCALWVGMGGPLPSDWRALPLRRCFDGVDYGIGERSEPSGRIAVLGMGNVEPRRVVGEPNGYVELLDDRLLLLPGDLLFNRTNSLALVGKVAIWFGSDQPMTFASYLVRLRTSSNADPRYLNYLLNTDEVLALARAMALPSIGQANLNPNRYGSLRIPLPPLSAQRRLARELEVEENKTEALAAKLQMQVLLLAEHRQALITAAVTGELEVPGVAA